MKTILLASIIFSTLLIFSQGVEAGSLNPCEMMNLNANAANKLDTGNDENFERIKQQNNRELIRNCQEYQIKLYEQRKADLNRDNY